MTRLGRSVMVLLAVAMLAGACGSDSDSDSDSEAGTGATTTGVPQAQAGAASPAAAKPTCELLSRDEVAQTVGNPVSAGVPAGKDCSWTTDVDGGTSLNLTVDKPAPAQAGTTCDFRKASISKENQERVSGVGNSAVWSVQTLSLLTQGNLVACYDNAVVWVIITGEKEAGALKSTATGVADKVRSRV